MRQRFKAEKLFCKEIKDQKKKGDKMESERDLGRCKKSQESSTKQPEAGYGAVSPGGPQQICLLRSVLLAHQKAEV